MLVNVSLVNAALDKHSDVRWVEKRSNIANISLTYFPPNFLCYTPVFSVDDSKIFFIGEWWE